jgi:hypothetical protein
MQLKKCYWKGCQLFAARVEEASRDVASNLEDDKVLKDFKDVFQEVPGLPLKRDIDFFYKFDARSSSSFEGSL